jgi:hypothetical protein
MRRWQREMDNAAATAEAKAIDAERDAAIVRDEYYNGESARWLDPVSPSDVQPPPLRLLTNEEIIARAAVADLGEQLVLSAVIELMKDVKELKQQVKELQHCQSAS